MKLQSQSRTNIRRGAKDSGAAVAIAWLEYARRLLADKRHHRECAAAGGSPSHPGVDATDLRWPGYLGKQYRWGGLLFVGNVHRDFASGGLTKSHRDRLVSATRDWKRQKVSDEQYLTAVRDVYKAGLQTWTVGKHLCAILRECGLSIDEIAFVNAARCQFPEVPPQPPNAASTKRKLVSICLQTYPIIELCKILRPRAVLFMSAYAYDVTVAQLPKRVICIAFNQRNGTLDRKLLIGRKELRIRTPLKEWTAVIRKAISRSSSTHRIQGRRRFRVGDWVRFVFGVKPVCGVILEDRGNIGAHGRQMYLVEVPLKYDEPLRFEMPADDPEPAPSAEK